MAIKMVQEGLSPQFGRPCAHLPGQAISGTVFLSRSHRLLIKLTGKKKDTYALCLLARSRALLGWCKEHVPAASVGSVVLGHGVVETEGKKTVDYQGCCSLGEIWLESDHFWRGTPPPRNKLGLMNMGQHQALAHDTETRQ